MSGWWLAAAIALLIVAVLCYLYLRTRGTGNTALNDDQALLRNFGQERETQRSGQMSAEDQSWEAETRQRDRDARAGTPSDREP
jgi:hypothetical protein